MSRYIDDEGYPAECTCEPGVGWTGPCHGEAPRGPVCFHCWCPIDERSCIEAPFGLCCSTLCAALMDTAEHDEGCDCLEAQDQWTLPKEAANGLA